MSRSGAARRIKEHALELGFCAVGIADSGRPLGADAFEEWLAEGRHADMGWIAERAAERLDPSLLIPEARSVIVVASDYGHGPDSPLPTGAGRVARYARGRDYHNVIGRRLMKLRRFLLQEMPGARVYKSVDAGAVLERSWAAASGLAAFGKATNVLDGERGSWLLLGVLVVDRPLPPDPPATDLCGECVACVEVCPTGAIVEPGVLDSRRCISYLTIEARRAIPEPLRERLGEWVMGCDDCQTVCPYSGDDRPPGDPALAPIPGREALDCIDLLGLADAEFHERFHGSPMRRAGGTNMRRNASLRLGNIGDRAALPELSRVLGEDPSEVVRGSAAWALGRLGGGGARRALEGRRRSEPSSDVRQEIEGALERT